MKTEDLIVELAGGARPLQRLPTPWRRAALWGAVTSAYLTMLVVLMAPANQVAAALRDPRFVFEQLASVLVGFTAGAAALGLVVPGYNRRLAILPIGAALLWSALLLSGSVQAVAAPGIVSAIQSEWPCVRAMVVIAALPAGVLVWMLRRGAPLAPRATLALAALSAAALANVATCAVRPHDVPAAVVLWHGATALALCGVAALLGGVVLRWSAPRSA